MDSMRLIEETLAPLAGKSVLDVGCGGGYLAKALVARGAAVTGIDPSHVEVGRAAALVPSARFEIARAEALPFADASFDGAIFLNSLHHVPAVLMRPALAEAGRVTGTRGLVIVVEPLAEGSFFAAFQPIDDETEVRAEAQHAVRQALQAGLFTLVRETEFNRRERFAGHDDFLTRATAADPDRSKTVARKRDEIEQAFRRHAALDAEGRFVLDQPLRAHVLRPEFPGT
jgi:SAM-dependent methyltransferase